MNQIGGTAGFISNVARHLMLHTEFIPSETPNSKALFIVLHGLGDSTAGFHWMPEELGLPDINYLLVNAPDRYYGGFSWYDFTGNEAAGIERSRGLLFQLLEQTRERGFPAAQTTLFGFSQGCLMTVDVGFRSRERLAGMVGVSGYIHQPERLLTELGPAARDQRMLFTHGTQDPMIPCAKVREQVKVLTAGGLNITWQEFPKAHTIAGEPELAVIREFVRAGSGRQGSDPTR